MRVALIVSCFCALLLCGSAGASTSAKYKPADSRKLGLVIRVEGEGWDGAEKRKIESVLYAVADALLSRLPKKMSVPIVVTHTDRNPVALYERGKNGEYLVQLHASGERWYLYVYEFAHELCHIISNYDSHLDSETRRENQWFEETVCETASLYALKRMATTWQASAPEWAAGHATDLRRYFDLLVGQEHRRLPPQTPLAAWLAPREPQLRSDPYQRRKNQLVANQLLPLFENDPENWDALSYLNLEPGHGRASLREYLRLWHKHAPENHKKFVAGIVALLDAAIEEAPPSSPSPAAPLRVLVDRATRPAVR
jgi:hypothetical protein